jgi:hypothetical protein
MTKVTRRGKILAAVVFAVLAYLAIGWAEKGTNPETGMPLGSGTTIRYDHRIKAPTPVWQRGTSHAGRTTRPSEVTTPPRHPGASLVPAPKLPQIDQHTQSEMFGGSGPMFGSDGTYNGMS